jgi:hypothetical protein
LFTVEPPTITIEWLKVTHANSMCEIGLSIGGNVLHLLDPFSSVYTSPYTTCSNAGAQMIPAPF